MPPSPPRAARTTGCVRLFSWKACLKSGDAHFTQCRHPEPLVEVHLIRVESECPDTERPPRSRSGNVSNVHTDERQDVRERRKRVFGLM